MISAIFLSSNLKTLLLGELTALVSEIKQLRETPLEETEGAGHSEYLQRRINLAREKVDALKRIQRREKLVRDRRREIDTENKKAEG